MFFVVNKIAIGVVVVVMITILVMLRFVSDSPSDVSDFIFHARLADSEMYQDGVYSDSFDVSPGKFNFLFILNGDSPDKLLITLKGDSFSFSEDFTLKGTLHKSALSEYYTWNYEGEKEIEISSNQTLQITIDPHGDFKGPLSVMLTKD